ncbi:MAG TPA: hypothetical protein VH500_00875 [Nitrososphaeraceae archaeon]
MSSKGSTTGTEIYHKECSKSQLSRLMHEHLMTACYPIEYVIRVIPALLKRYEILGDLSSINEALDRHRHNAEMYLKRYMYR